MSSEDVAPGSGFTSRRPLGNLGPRLAGGGHGAGGAGAGHSPAEARAAVQRALQKLAGKPQPVIVVHKIAGFLVDETTQAPIKGAAFEIESGGTVIARGVTDGQGAIAHLVPPGRYKIRIRGEVARPPLFEVAGVIADTTGRLLAGVAYEILAPDGRVLGSGTTDETGMVRKTVAPGRYKVRVKSDPEKRQLKAQVPIRLSFGTLDEANDWLGRNRAEVEIDGKPVPCGAVAESATRIVIQFRVPPGEHDVVVSTVEEAAGGGEPVRMVHISEKITLERGEADA
jgi:hypothetical protein